MSQNRRSATRHDVHLPATLTVDGDSTEEELHNLSLGGAHVTSAKRHTMGTRVTLTFRVPSHDGPIEIGGQVRWATESGLGIQFDGFRAREVWSLNKYFAELDE